MDSHSNGGRSNYFSVKQIARLKHFEDGAILMIGGVHAFDGLMEMRIEELAKRIDALGAKALQRVKKLSLNELEPLAVFFVCRLLVRGQGALEGVEHGQKTLDGMPGDATGILPAFALHALARVFKIGLAACKSLPRFIELGLELCDLGGRIARLLISGASRNGSSSRGVIGIRYDVYPGILFIVLNHLQKLLGKIRLC